MLSQKDIEKYAHEHPFLSKADLVYTMLRDEIENNILPGGTKIVQEEVSSLFNISRSPVREALQRLCDDGFLRRDGAMGYCVYEFRFADYLLLNDYRTMQEVFGTQQCVRYISTRELALLRENLAVSEAAAARGDIKDFAELDREFHIIIIKASRNPYLIRSYEQQFHLYHFFRNLTLMASSIPEALRHHNMLYRAIEAGNVAEAGRIARLHREHTCHAALMISRGAEDLPD